MINEAIQIIRELDELDCPELQSLLLAIEKKMSQTGYSDLDLLILNDAIGVITGETK